jgi:type IV fimbrial biogenesis protein FimT
VAKFNGGFTLIELLVVVALVAILAIIGIPSYQSSIVNMDISADANALWSDFQVARSEAIKRGVAITICPMSAAATGNYICSGSNTWTTGWMICATCTAASNSGLIRVQSAITNGDAIVSPTLSAVTYNPFGLIATGNSGSISITSNIIASASNKQLCISTLGNLQVQSSATVCP